MTDMTLVERLKTFVTVATDAIVSIESFLVCFHLLPVGTDGLNWVFFSLALPQKCQSVREGFNEKIS